MADDSLYFGEAGTYLNAFASVWILAWLHDPNLWGNTPEINMPQIFVTLGLSLMIELNKFRPFMVVEINYMKSMRQIIENLLIPRRIEIFH